MDTWAPHTAWVSVLQELVPISAVRLTAMFAIIVECTVFIGNSHDSGARLIRDNDVVPSSSAAQRATYNSHILLLGHMYFLNSRYVCLIRSV